MTDPLHPPLVSVLVPCFRSARFLRRSVGSALAQTERDLEVVVVDNASDDGTFELAGELAAADRRVRVARNAENLGPVRNWRRCAELARGEYAALLFSDDWYQPDYLAEAVALLRADPGVGFVYPPVRVVFEDEKLVARGETLSYRLEPGIHAVRDYLSEILEKGMMGAPVSPGCAVFRREDLQRFLAGDLPDPHAAGYLAHGAGPDLWVYLQACLAYPRFAHLARPLVQFSAHGGNLTFSPGIQAAYALARLAFLEAHREVAVDRALATAHCWMTLRREPRRTVAEAMMGLDAWLATGPAVETQAIEASRREEQRRVVAAHRSRPVRDVPGLPPEVFDALPPLPPGTPYDVTAVVSTYKSARFLRGCLDDLLGQTLHDQGRLEIVVVDTGSPEDEAAIVAEYQRRSPHLRLIRTEERRTLYAAWNMGIAAARARYVTNANTDDRHRADGLERLCAALDAHPEADVAYADQLWTSVENEAFGATASRQRGCWGAADEVSLRTQCMLGPQPMWRRALHGVHGYFDPSFASAGDWEFWLRIAPHARFLKVDEVLGLYLVNLQGLEHSHPQSRQETLRIRERYAVAPWEAELTAVRSRFACWDPALHDDPSRPDLSVVVTAPRAADLLAQALASVGLQEEASLELILVEAGRGEAVALLDRLRRQRPGLIARVVREKRRGAAAWNAGVAAARGRFVTCLGERDLLEPMFCREALRALAEQPMAAVAYTDVRRLDGSGAVVESGAWSAEALRQGASFPSTVVLHRRLLAAQGGFTDRPEPASLRDLLARSAERRLPAVHVPAPLVVQR